MSTVTPISGLFGLFVAQVTGSFVIAGAEFVTHDFGIAGKLLAIAAFLTAAAATAALITLTRNAERTALPFMLGLEALLLAAFAAIVVFGPPIKDARDWHGIAAGMFAAMAMGAQSVLVRLLMRDIPQTDVMTGNITQLGIAITDIIMARRRFARSRHDAAAIAEFEHVRERLLTVLSIALGTHGERRVRRGRLRCGRSARRAPRRRHRRGDSAMGGDAARAGVRRAGPPRIAYRDPTLPLRGDRRIRTFAAVSFSGAPARGCARC